MNRIQKVSFLGLVIVVSLLIWISLPKQLFSDPLSTAVYDRNGELLGARIAPDGQWRFPGLDSVPEKYAQALITFEDRLFHYHPGVNPWSISRAAIQNIKAGKIESGGSTISMQVIRLSRKNKARNLCEKIIESFLALRMEVSYSKNEILQLYAENAPFGGNVVGLEAASWRYFGTPPSQLTWAESAMLAVLPNAPALIHPGKNRLALKAKRDRLLEKIYVSGKLDSLSFVLAKEEAIPEAPRPLPNLAPHLTDRIMLDDSRNSLTSSLDIRLQTRVSEGLALRNEELAANEIHNLACMVMDVESGEVLAYVGNAVNSGTDHGAAVDVIQAERSSGSILKPFLFAGLLDNGSILQSSLVPDVPIRYNGYSPKNYNRGYAGAVPAYQALERSLNIPSVIMLKRYGIDPFLGLLRHVGFSTFSHSKDYYGLTVILGGAETTLWELTGVYGSLARVLNHYNRYEGSYFAGDYHMPVLNQKATTFNSEYKQEEGILSASSIYFTLESLLEVNRPEELSKWYLLSSSRKIAWKTGTSYGYRDAWAIGVTPEYVVAVWAGNADGEGRTGLSGVNSAAPLLFDVFSLLPETSWFAPPLDNMAEALVCRESGYLATANCTETDTISVVPKGLHSKPCPYHYMIHLDQEEKYRVNSACYQVSEMKSRSWFVLPPLMEWYYKFHNASYRELPPMSDECQDDLVKVFEIVYPEQGSHLVIPRELDGTKGKVVFEISHRNPETEVYWHIDESYFGTTRDKHQIAIDILPGLHTLTVVDKKGNTQTVSFEVLR